MKLKRGKKHSSVIYYNSTCISNFIDLLNSYYRIPITNMDFIKPTINEFIDIVGDTPIRLTIFKSKFAKFLKLKFGIHCNKVSNINYWLIRGYNHIDAIKSLKLIQQSKSLKQTVESKTQKGLKFKANAAAGKHKIGNKFGRGNMFYKHIGIDEDKISIKLATRNQKWQQSLQFAIINDPSINKRKGKTFLELVKKHGYDGAKQICKKRLHNFTGISKIQLEFCSNLITTGKFKDTDCRYGEDELHLWENDIHYKYDFCYKNVIVEFNGDFWHMNPTIYTSTDINKVTMKTALETWNNDHNKHQLAIKRGYNIITVWEQTYKQDPINTINQILTKIHEKIIN